MRAEIERDRVDHDGAPPASLGDLMVRPGNQRRPGNQCDSDGEFGPNMVQIPQDHLSNTNIFTLSGSSPIEVSGQACGWIYDPVRGELRINHVRYCNR